MIRDSTHDKASALFCGPCTGGASSDIPALDLVGQSLDELGDLLQMRIDLERAAECLERAFPLPHLPPPHPAPGHRPDPPRPPRPPPAPAAPPLPPLPPPAPH